MWKSMRSEISFGRRLKVPDAGKGNPERNGCSVLYIFRRPLELIIQGGKKWQRDWKCCCWMMNLLWGSG